MRPNSRLCSIYGEFNNKRDEKQSKLDYGEIYASVRVISVVAKIDGGDPERTYESRTLVEVYITNLNETN